MSATPTRRQALMALAAPALSAALPPASAQPAPAS